MIAGFADATTHDIHHRLDTKAARKIPRAVWPAAQRKLDIIEAATQLEDIGQLPGNRLEKLKGNLKGRWSIRVNDQYRIVFGWEAPHANNVLLTDYH